MDKIEKKKIKKIITKAQKKKLKEFRIGSYDKYIVAFSGGKDSTALVLHLLEAGIPKDRIELWHHDVDGKEDTFMDWEVTPAYCLAFAKAVGIPIYFSWKKGGFKGEMSRDNQPTAPTYFEIPYMPNDAAERGLKIETIDGKLVQIVGGNGPVGTRKKFPQISGDLSVRWCSSYLKIDICATAIRNQARFNGLKTIVLSGERGEESDARGNYEILERDRSDLRDGLKFKRWVDRYRPIRDWTEKQIWEIIERHKIRVHPCYYLGWGRCSCKFCIFARPNQMCSAFKISPAQGEQLAAIESEFNTTMQRKKNLKDFIAQGEPYEMDDDMIAQAISKEYNLSIIMDKWILPKGAYAGESCGPI